MTVSKCGAAAVFDEREQRWVGLLVKGQWFSCMQPFVADIEIIVNGLSVSLSQGYSYSGVGGGLTEKGASWKLSRCVQLPLVSSLLAGNMTNSEEMIITI